MIPVICVVGASNSGKTTLLEKLIPEFKRRGYRIGTIKHDIHTFEMDHEGKDTWRHKQAGASTVTIVSPIQVATIKDTSDEMPLEEVINRYLWQEDLILVEGYKRSSYPKIEVYRSDVETKPICTLKDNLIALVTDEEVELEVPRFGFDETKQLADFLEKRFLKARKVPGVLVQLNGKKLPMKDFVQEFLAGGILGMLSQLKGWDQPQDIQIFIRVPRRP